MAMDGYVQLAADGSGRRVANYAVKVPAGTVVLDASGTASALAAETTVFLQRVALSDGEGNELDLAAAAWKTAVLAELRAGRQLLQKLLGDLPTDDPPEV
jgi:hypothetical protein